MTTTLLIATGNAGKLRELRTMLDGFTLVSLKDVGNPTLDEPYESYVGNAKAKALQASRLTGMLTLADDSGLELDALGGAPGWYSALYGGGHGVDAANRAKLLSALKGVPDERRVARFRCAVVIADTRGPLGERVLVGEGQCRGRVVSEPRGSGGFGYDPLLVPEGHSETLAELDEAVKNALSHRFRAVKDVLPALRGYVEARALK